MLESVEKVKENRKDLESLSSLLQEAINECEPNEIQKGKPWQKWSPKLMNTLKESMLS